MDSSVGQRRQRIQATMKPVERSILGLRTAQERSSWSSHCRTYRGSEELPLMVFSIGYILLQITPFTMFAKKKLKREDFIFENGWFDSATRGPGELHMQQFQISDCEQSTICLFDAAACVYIDQCKYCIVFVGACEASVFVRDCSHTIVICTTQQFRVRDCTHCHFALCCDSQPIIESSHNITISNFPLWGYAQLAQQMTQAKTSPWNNNWFDVYDFTPNKFNTQNFRLAPMSNQQLKKVQEKVQEKMKEAQLTWGDPVIPRTQGKGHYSVEEISVLVAYPVPDAVASQEYPLLQSRVHHIPAEEVKALGLSLESQGRVKILFVKILRSQLGRWKKALKNIIAVVQAKEQLELYEGTVFAPFKDEH